MMISKHAQSERQLLIKNVFRNRLDHYENGRSDSISVVSKPDDDRIV